MLSFLNHVRDRQPPRSYPNLENIRRIFNHNLDSIRNYWQQMNWVVRSEHVLVGLIHHLHCESQDKFRIYDSISSITLSVTSGRGIVSNKYYGRIQPISHFYGQGCQEILIEQQFDDAYEQMMFKSYKDWETVRVVSHPFTSFDSQIPNGKKRQSDETGLCIIKIDLALLFTQYMMWVQDRMASRNDEDVLKPIANFVHAYPLPNMLKSHNECVWFNRIFFHAKGIPTVDIREDSRHRMLDPYYAVDQVAMKIIDDLNRGRGNMHEWVSQIPGIFYPNMKSFYLQDDVLQNQQNRLTWYLGWLPMLSFLFQMDFEGRHKGNTTYIAEYKRKYAELKSSRTYETIQGLKGDVVLNWFNEKIGIYMDI